jgi:D-alanine-D-alanine ligase
MPGVTKKRLDVTVLADEECVEDNDPLFFGRKNGASPEYLVVNALRSLGHRVSVVSVGDEVGPIVGHCTDTRPDLVFNLTEQFRDDRMLDRNVSALLELLDVPFTGTGSLGLTLCRDKGYCKRILGTFGIQTARHCTVPPGKKPVTPAGMTFPLVVKPLTEDGSDGISNASLVRSPGELAARVRMVHRVFSQPAMVEEYIDGRELYVSVLGNGRPVVLPPRELFLPRSRRGGPVMATKKVKWDGKYRKRWNVRYGFARLGAPLLTRIERVSALAFRVLHMRDYGRIDIRVRGDGSIVVIEANPNPNLAGNDEVARSAARAGYSYVGLIGHIMSLALLRTRRRAR